MKKIFNLATRFFAKFSDFKLKPRKDRVFKDMDTAFRPIFEKCSPYSMTSVERMYSLYKSVEYVVKKNIPGDFVECGVWRGGSSMIIAETLLLLGVTDRKIYLYDTFEGMPEPDTQDNKIRGGVIGKKVWSKQQDNGGWLVATLENVKQNLSKTNYPPENLVFTKGLVEETIPKVCPEKISLLRLDTDFYASTYHEFTHMYPKLQDNGVLIVDDYGSWQGSKKATDQYFEENNINILINRVDSGIVAIKN